MLLQEQFCQFIVTVCSDIALLFPLPSVTVQVTIVTPEGRKVLVTVKTEQYCLLKVFLKNTLEDVQSESAFRCI
jgi:hypothetical protein